MSPSPSAIEALFALAKGGSHEALTFYDAVLELREHSRVHTAVDPEHLLGLPGELTTLLEPATSRGLVQHSVKYRPDGRAYLELETSSTVGFSSITSPDGRRLFLRVRPKINTVRMLELASMAGMLPTLVGAPPAWTDRTADEAVLEWTAEAFTSALADLMSKGGLRATHERRRQVLRHRVRGSIHVPSYLRSISRGQLELIPCTFPTLDTDNGPNRLLRWALHLLSSALQARRHEGGRAASLYSECTGMERRMAAIPLERPGSGRLPGERSLPRNMHHYDNALALARAIVRDVHLDGAAGGQRAVTVALDMNVVFESAFARGAQMRSPAAMAQQSWHFPLTRVDERGGRLDAGRSAEFKPDVVLDGTNDHVPIVLDTKWKDVLEGVSKDSEKEFLRVRGRVKLRNSDLFQVTSYGLESMRRTRRDGVLAVLVYPCLEDLPELGYVLEQGGVTLRVVLAGWNLTRPASDGFNDLWDGLLTSASELHSELLQRADQRTSPKDGQ
jgi:5-methylcytosine-specific restriction endonuclease McrBC regulatory subunit McrC